MTFVCMILPGGGCRLQTCRGLAAQWFDSTLRTSVDVFHPMSSGVAALTRKLKLSFDPAGILNPGKMNLEN